MKLYQLDAFADRVFSGNPAAVVPLTAWLPDAVMQQIAAENNLAETAFYVQTTDETHYHIRWFTPTVEVDLCGHATLAAAYVVFWHEQKPQPDTLTFASRSGPLGVQRTADGWLTLDFPADVLQPVIVWPPALLEGLLSKPQQLWRGRSDLLAVYETQTQVENLKPNFEPLAALAARGLIVTAPADAGAGVDFVSRFFAPQSGIDEDPVTGSAHTTLTPYWAGQLGRNTLLARQVSARGGLLKCQRNADRVAISGQVQLYLIGEIQLQTPTA